MRNSLVEVSLRRIRLNLCCTSGWSITLICIRNLLTRCGLAVPITVPSPGGDAAIAELEFLHLAVLGHRQRVDEFDETRHREISESWPAEFAERAFGERAARTPHDGGHDLVLGEFGRHRKHRGIADLG